MTLPKWVTGNLVPIFGLELRHVGKVRDTYALPDYPDEMLVVASDRVSIFDFVLPAVVPGKGEVLNALNIFWRRRFDSLFPHDSFCSGVGINNALPAYSRHRTDLEKRAVVVHRLEMLEIEAIVRGYLTGSGLAAYNEKTSLPGCPGQVCGHSLPPGLRDGSELPYPIFTPTTKAKEGHDEHVTADSVAVAHGIGPERLALQLFSAGAQYARERGIILADSKFEFGRDSSGRLIVADEVLTPDSSRFWDEDDWGRSRAQGKSPQSYDKQFVRAWGKTVGIDKLDPRDPAHLEEVGRLTVPSDVLAMTTKIYRYIFWRLVGKKLEAYQRNEMCIVAAQPKRVKIDIVVGSKNDLPQLEQNLIVMKRFEKSGSIAGSINVVSCHRNPDALRQYAEQLDPDHVVIAAAGKAAALPGVLASWLRHYGKGQVPVLAVALEAKASTPDLARRAMDAAELSIEELPSTPNIVLAEDGRCYRGAKGFLDAFLAALQNEFFIPPSDNAPPPPVFGISYADSGAV